MDLDEELDDSNFDTFDNDSKNISAFEVEDSI